VTLAIWQRIMGGMQPRRRECAPVRRFLASALAVALIHQLGACPCGCIEGNLWVQSYLRLRGRIQAPMAQAVANKTVPTSVDAKACEEDHAHVAYVASSGSTLADTHVASSFTVALCPDGSTIAGLQYSQQQHIRAGGWQPPGPSARTLRAQFQVFLI
jgi:hypothetical protein